MKSKFLVPALTAAIGFTVAWVAKPGGSAMSVGEQSEATTANRPARVDNDNRPSPGDGKRPVEVKAGDFPLADQADQGPKTRDEARMLRLTEALGLTIDQQGDIIQLVADVQASADGKVSVIQDLTTRGHAIEDGLAKVLTPEQLAKFQEIRVRERDKRIEDRSQKMLLQAIEDIDVSPEQREDALSRFRQKSKAELQSIPAAATLLLDKSMLPTNNKELSVDGVLLLAKLGEEPTTTGDLMKTHQQVLDNQRGELEENLKCVAGILTAGQMGQYQAALAETRAIMKRLPQTPPPRDEPPAVAPTPDPPIQVIIEDDVDAGEEEEP